MAQFSSIPKAAIARTTDPDLLAWSQGDIENRYGFKGGRHTGVNHVFAFVIALLLTGAMYALTVFVLQRLAFAKPIAEMVLRPGNQYTMIPATLFFFGGAAVLFLKGRKLKFQERALSLSAVPAEPEFVLTEEIGRASCRERV